MVVLPASLATFVPVLNSIRSYSSVILPSAWPPAQLSEDIWRFSFCKLYYLSVYAIIRRPAQASQPGLPVGWMAAWLAGWLVETFLILIGYGTFSSTSFSHTFRF